MGTDKISPEGKIMRTFVNITAGKTMALVMGLLLCFGASQSWAQDNTDVEQQSLELNQDRIERIAVIGNERIEPATISSYLVVAPGSPFDPALIDRSLKTLFATGLFADVVMERDEGTLLIRVIENPIINRVVFEGNRRLKRDKLLEEVQLRPRMIYTRAKVSADVGRIIELYRRSGRFAAVVEPKIIQLDQNRVNLVFEITEGPKSRVSRVNFIGNKEFSDNKLRKVMATKESRWWKIFGSDDTYDPDRLAYDRELLRQHYLQNGFADFRIVASVAELTPELDDFFITFTVEEGEVYTFGKIEVESEVKDLKPDFMRLFVTAKEGQTYNAKQIENTIDAITNMGGILGFAFLDIEPVLDRDKETRTLSLKFIINQSRRTYVERINITGNVRTLDRVVRREFRLVEGDAFNSIKVKRSESRLRSLGFFKEVEIEQSEGTQPDRVIMDVTVQEQPTGEFQFGGGFSSYEKFMLNISMSERNLRGRGQNGTIAFTYSRLRKQLQLSFTEPYFMNKQISAGFDLYRSESSSYISSSYSTNTTGFGLRLGFAVSEYIFAQLRYSLRADDVQLEGTFDSPFLLDSIGKYTTSSIGYSLGHDSLNHYLKPTDGQRITFAQDLAGLGGNVRYIRTTFEYDRFEDLYKGFIFHLGAEAGHIKGLGQDVRINNRFFLGNPRFRGFAAAGVGPIDLLTNNFLGGNIYYVGTAEVFLPLGRAADEMGLKVSTFVEVGALAKPDLREFDNDGNPIDNTFLFSNGAPRVSVGVGVTWDSPFGPFRIDMAKVIKKQPTDKTEFLQFNIGTMF